MSRRSFFSGLFTGLITGVLLMVAVHSLFLANRPHNTPAAVVPRIVPITVRVEEPIAPPQKSIPENWQEYEFNGRPVYVIPLALREPLADH